MRVITREQLRAVLDLAGVMPFDGGLISDRHYVLPDRQWLAAGFSYAFRKFREDLNIHKWLPEKNDCDNHALAGVFFARLLHARTSNAPEAELAFGEFWYARDAGGGHGINFAVIPAETQTGLSLLFYEPQLTSIVTLSPTEVGACMGYYI